MLDLNDLHYFTQVVSHGSFASAGRALRIPKSRLSRRVAELEAQLGVRLIERSSRRFRVTEIGATFYEQSLPAVEAARRAEAAVAASLSEPRGIVRFSCPTGLVEIIAPLLPDFLTRHPKVAVQVIAADRPVDLVNERIDVALRVRVQIETDAELTMRTLGRSRRALYASPALANSMNLQDIDRLAEAPTLGTSDEIGDALWTLENMQGDLREFRLAPRMSCSDLGAVREAAVAGLGVAFLPDHVCQRPLATGALVPVFTDWRGRDGVVHLVFTTRIGLPPHVRAWIDHLGACFPKSFSAAGAGSA